MIATLANPISRTALLAAAALAAHLSFAAGANTLYVSDERGGDVVALNAETGAVLARIAVGKRPRGIALSRDGKQLFVALSGSPIAGPGVDESTLPPPDRRFDGIGVVDIRTHKLLRTIQSGADPENFALSPDGKTLFVSNEDTSALSAVDVASGRVRLSGKVGVEPEGVAVRPDGRVVYVTCEGTSTVHVLDTTTMTELARIKTEARPRNVIFTRDGTLAFISSEVGSAVTIVDATKHVITHVIRLTGAKDQVMRPMGLALTPDESTLYVTTGRASSLVQIDVRQARVVHSIEKVGERPWGLTLNSDGRLAYTANGPAGDVSVVELATGKVLKHYPVGVSPWGLVELRPDRPLH
jgi:YVTN family beta-propeller protein